jgi:hypothetical protein
MAKWQASSIQRKKTKTKKRQYLAIDLERALMRLAKRAGRVSPGHKDPAKTTIINSPKDPDQAAFTIEHALGALEILYRERNFLEQIVKCGAHLYNTTAPGANNAHIVSGGVTLIGKDADTLVRCLNEHCALCKARALYKDAIAMLDKMQKKSFIAEASEPTKEQLDGFGG